MDDSETLLDRVKGIKQYELLIFFTLLVLLAICIVVSRVIIHDVREPQQTKGKGLEI